MKKLVLLIAIVGLLFVFYLLVRAFPYLAYLEAIDLGMNNEFLVLEKPRKELLDTGEYDLVKMHGLYGEDKSYWREFHFRHFMLPMPVHHPVYLFFPLIEIDEKNNMPMFGVKITDFKQQEIFSFKVKEISDFKWDLSTTKIFNLAVFKNHIMAHNQKDIWKDLFSKDLEIQKFDWGKLPEVYSEWTKFRYKDLVYNLFILRLREILLPTDAKDISFYTSKGAGAYEITDDETKLNRVKNYRQERILFLENGKIFTFEIRTRLDMLEAEALRQKYLKEISFKYSAESSSTELYNKFKVLPFDKKIDQEGLVYLFTAWSHVPDNKLFLREMIQFLERGKKNDLNLAPLYEYARLMFGSNFSTSEETMDETAEEKVKRLRRVELEQELKNAQEDGPQIEYDKFESPEQRMKYLLQKAKDSGVDIDKEEKKIKVD
ncbi:MAG: hypothetical protein OHK0056_07770 [Bacteriovoracaceae bacterium]